MEFTLAYVKCQIISMGDNFSPESYKKENRLSTPRLFLLTRDKGLLSEQSDNEDLMESPFDSSSQREKLLSSPVSGTVQNDPVGSPSKESKTLGNSAKENVQGNDVSLTRTHSEGDASERFKDGLIGTSDQRKEFMERLNADYQVSLAANKEKRLQLEADIRRESLRESRENRVPLELASHKARVTVSVRHPNLGIIKRTFVFFFIFPLNKYEYNIFNKISTVKKKWKGHKYSNLIICPLIEYISFRIKRKLERTE